MISIANVLFSALQAIAGVTVVKAEMGEEVELPTTLKGVDALFIVTPSSENRATLAIKTAKVAKAAGVKFIAVVSVLVAELTDTVLGKQFSEIERAILKLGVPYTILQLPKFVEVYWGFRDGIVGQSSIFSPVDPTKPYTAVVVEDIGKAAAAILADPQKHAGKTYQIVSERHTFNDVAAAFSEVLGKEVKYIRVPYEAAKKALRDTGLQEWEVTLVIELNLLVDNGAPETTLGNPSDFTALTGEQPTSIKSWVRKYAGAFQ